MGVAAETVVRNRALQTEWYGEPLGDRVRRLLARLDLSQSALAGVLGLSAPMLSQLMSAQRAKISNPAVLHRLLAAEELVAGPGFRSMPAAEVKERLAAISAETAATTSGVRLTGTGGSPAGAGNRPSNGAAQDGVAQDGPAQGGPMRGGPAQGGVAGGAPVHAEQPARVVQSLLREVASAADIEAAAGLIGDRFPDLAELLRVYGNGRTSEAEAHYARVVRDARGY
ncbi:helix-turn-helix domain-containing protein [Actinomadura verrucosospora]|uniref:XRE family transcriptional regulator n=1 Tax=Actinomadura verrucosospora TaxID=46165 RepID=A0A7D3VT66_ACTVE|nr:helix-turn-helix domain-containing protein [Actinomadura verrucosospora]QKG22053.1 XRE family transcriptional regulator [Actinomadura verrucosospora]